ncbi:hypothetical protein BDZ45DRAFT_680282 [Acephala macrosclerotiorum]|nr:hypothetical protein BDZ45DRAFT_680282 [Acephala macrosclerotiorum]
MESSVWGGFLCMAFFTFRFIFALWVEVDSWRGDTSGMKRSRVFTGGMDSCWLA